MRRADLVGRFGVHWRLDCESGSCAVRETPGALYDQEDDARFSDLAPALEAAYQRTLAELEEAETEAREMLQEASGTLFRRIACALDPRGRLGLQRDLARYRLSVFADRLFQARQGHAVVPRFHLPDDVQVPDPLPIGTEVWVVKADWAETQGIRIQEGRVAEAYFSPVVAIDGDAWRVSYVAIGPDMGRVGFRHDAVAEDGAIDLRVHGWSGHLSKEKAEAAASRIVARLRQSDDAALPFVMPGEHDDVPPQMDEEKAAELKMWLMVRTDLDMPRPKGFGQAGHGFAAALWKARLLRPEVADAYMAAAGQAKIVVGVKNADVLRRACEDCEAAGLPAVIVRDAGRTVFPEPTLTVAAVGPCRRDELPKFVQRLQILKK